MNFIFLTLIYKVKYIKHIFWVKPRSQFISSNDNNNQVQWSGLGHELKLKKMFFDQN